MLVGILVLVIGFIYYASSPVYSENTYNQIVQFSQESSKRDTITVMSYNIGYMSGMTNNRPIPRTRKLFDGNLEKSIQLFNTYSPDIIGLQEVDFNADRSFNRNQSDSLAVSGGFSHAQISVNWDKKYVPFPYYPLSMHFREILSGQSILSKFPIVESERIVLPGQVNPNYFYNLFYIDRLIQISKIDLGEQFLYVLNVHLEAYDKDARARQAEIVVDYFSKYSSDFPTILIGDFNAEPYGENSSDRTFDIIMSARNIAHAFNKDQLLVNPEQWSTYSSEDPTVKIDYIFYSKDKITPLKYKVLREAVDISDHLPILFSFVITE
ncbi:MAG: endonuclease/exonuclease/phosphatase family protein [Cyclobacteriaceae bacterium]